MEAEIDSGVFDYDAYPEECPLLHEAHKDEQEIGCTQDEVEQNESKCCGFGKNKVLTLISIASVNFCLMACYSILAPFFPNEAMHKGATDTIVGLIFGIFSLTALVFSPIAGRYIVHIGAKFMFVSGILISGVCTVLFGLLDKASSGPMYITLCFVVRTFDAIGFAFSSTTSSAIMAQNFPDNIATLMGVLEIFTGLGLLLGPPLGGFLYSAWGYEMPFFIIGGLLLLMVPLNMILLPSQEGTIFKASFFRLLMLPPIIMSSVLVVLQACSVGFLDPTISIFLKNQFQLKPKYIGLVFLTLSATYAIGSPIIGYLCDLKPNLRRPSMVIGSLMSGICFCMMGPAPFIYAHQQLWIMVLSLAINGLALGFTVVPIFAEMLDTALQNGFEEGLSTMGLVSGLFGSMWSVGNFLGPTLGGYLNDHLHFQWAATIQGSLMLAVGVIACVYYLKDAAQWRLKRESEGTRERTKEETSDETAPFILSHIGDYGVIESGK
uniref:Solute carrier family 18 member B1 n=1 Tax=Eptatretus burgeri TaxID=7764 RepID=A0A8C4NH02_EPTBU